FVLAEGCSSQPIFTGEEHVASTSQGLSGLSDGSPCSAASQCSSGFCVDAVCCDTACVNGASGARDEFSCSKIYDINGNVSSVVAGTCTTLAIGEACGNITSMLNGQCIIRGTAINGGGNCPNPPAADLPCYPCATSNDCNAAYPYCDTGIS